MHYHYHAGAIGGDFGRSEEVEDIVDIIIHLQKYMRSCVYHTYELTGNERPVFVKLHIFHHVLLGKPNMLQIQCYCTWGSNDSSKGMWKPSSEVQFRPCYGLT